MKIADRQGRGPERIGLFGGTFNPVHNGHLHSALDVLRLLHLNRLIFIPSAYPPHKFDNSLAAAQDRLAMVKLAIAGQAGLESSDLEIQRGGRSYTWDTLHIYQQTIYPGSELFFMLGIDAFLEIDSWKNARQLFDEAAFVIVSRPPHDPAAAAWQARLAQYIREQVAEGYFFEPQHRRFRHPDKRPIYLVRVAPVDISSSRIRAMAAAGQSIRDWVPPAVADYISKKGLYR